MKIRKKLLTAVVTLAMALEWVLPGTATATATEEPKKLDILFTHDIHSHLNSFRTVNEDDEKAVEVGGLSRMMTVAKQQFAVNPDTLFVDAGDFSMGTVVQAVFETDAVELRMLGALGVDAAVFGNHEFDYGPNGLANSLLTAKNSGEKIPEIVLSNLDMEATRAEPQSDARDALLEAFKQYGVKEYVMVQKGDVRIAIMGIFGLDALDCAPFSELVFKDPVEGAKATVQKIKATEDADIIVCLSHSGTWTEESKSEDEILAKNVPDIDVIISGHTHTTLKEPMVHGTTYIVSADEYGRYLGSLSLEQRADGKWNLTNYELQEITPEVPQDEEMQAKIDACLEQADIRYLSVYGYERTQVLAENEVKFVESSSLGSKHVERNLGSIIADSYRYYLEHLPDWDGVAVDVSVVPSGFVRETYPIGEITVEDVFNSFSIGIGEDGRAGYPLVSAYLNGAELKLISEIDASISPLMPDARLYTSGLQWTFNPNRMILSKSYDMYLVTLSGERMEIEEEKLYRVVTDLYSLKLLESVTDLSYGLLSMIPKDANGNPIGSFSETIVHTEGREVKAWEAIAGYMESFPDTDGNGVPNVDSRYAAEEGRKVVEDSKNIVNLVKKPNKFFFVIVGIIMAVVCILVLLIVLVIKIVKRCCNRQYVNLRGTKFKNKFFY